MSVLALRLFELLPRHPVVTVASVMRFVETTKPTAGRAIELLVAAGALVETTGRKRDGRLRIGPAGGMDDSLFVSIPNAEGASWQVINGISGHDVAGNPGHRPQALVRSTGATTTVGVWKWAVLGSLRFVVPEGQLTQTFSFATREDGLDIDGFAFAFAFALAPPGSSVGFKTDQLDAGEAGVPQPEPFPYQPE